MLYRICVNSSIWLCYCICVHAAVKRKYFKAYLLYTVWICVSQSILVFFSEIVQEWFRGQWAEPRLRCSNWTVNVLEANEKTPLYSISRELSLRPQPPRRSQMSSAHIIQHPSCYNGNMRWQQMDDSNDYRDGWTAGGRGGRQVVVCHSVRIQQMVCHSTFQVSSDNL